MAVSDILMKGIGYASLGLLAYDAHNFGKIEAASYQKNHKSEMIKDSFMDSMKQERPSAVQMELKKRVHNFRTDENMSEFFTGIWGYAKGFCNMLVNDVIPLGLAIGTVVSPKGLISKAFGAGLLVYGGIYFLQNILGIGKPKE